MLTKIYWCLVGVLALAAIPLLWSPAPDDGEWKPTKLSEDERSEVRAQLARPSTEAIQKLEALPGVAQAEWREKQKTLFVFVTVQGTDEDFELLALQICQSLALNGTYLHILDHRFAQLGKTKTREHTLCR